MMEEGGGVRRTLLISTLSKLKERKLMMWNRLILFVIGFYSIKHNSDCQGRHSRITSKVVPDIESFLTSLRDGLYIGLYYCHQLLEMLLPDLIHSFILLTICLTELNFTFITSTSQSFHSSAYLRIRTTRSQVAFY